MKYAPSLWQKLNARPPCTSKQTIMWWLTESSGFPGRKVSCLFSWRYTLPACSGPLLYEMPLAEINKMLELIKTPIKTPKGKSPQTVVRHIFSTSSSILSRSGSTIKYPQCDYHEWEIFKVKQCVVFFFKVHMFRHKFKNGTLQDWDNVCI